MVCFHTVPTVRDRGQGLRHVEAVQPCESGTEGRSRDSVRGHSRALERSGSGCLDKGDNQTLHSQCDVSGRDSAEPAFVHDQRWQSAMQCYSRTLLGTLVHCLDLNWLKLCPLTMDMRRLTQRRTRIQVTEPEHDRKQARSGIFSNTRPPRLDSQILLSNGDARTSTT